MKIEILVSFPKSISFLDYLSSPESTNQIVQHGLHHTSRQTPRSNLHRIFIDHRQGPSGIGKVAQAAGEMGLTVSNGRDYYHDKTIKHSFVRLGFASLNAKEMEEAVVILKKAVKKTSKK
jgi:DNA-binding transcriptional MocR family regulator